MTPLIYFKRLLHHTNVAVVFACLLLITTAFLKPLVLSQPVYSFQIGFDISQSMNVADIEDNGRLITRLDYAKQTAASMLRELPCGSSIGWSVFTGRRTLTLIKPLEVCEHYAGLSAALEQITGTMRWNNGSSIGKGVHQLMKAAYDFDDHPNIVLMTDGQEAPPLEPGQRGVPNTDKFEISGLLVGVGGRTPMPIPKSNADGVQIGFWTAQEVVQRPGAMPVGGGEELSRRDDERLQTLARLTQLDYVSLDSPAALVTTAMKSDFALHRDTPTDMRWALALLALALLIWRFFPGHLFSRN